MLENNNNNNSKVAIVTGASSGIGYAASLALSKAGIRVAVGARRMDRLQELEEQIVKNHDEGERGVEEEEEKFIEASKNMERLQSDDVANAILYAIQAPNHVNVNEILIRPTAQER